MIYINYRVQSIPMVSQMNPMHNTTTWYFNIHFIHPIDFKIIHMVSSLRILWLKSVCSYLSSLRRVLCASISSLSSLLPPKYIENNIFARQIVIGECGFQSTVHCDSLIVTHLILEGDWPYTAYNKYIYIYIYIYSH